MITFPGFEEGQCISDNAQQKPEFSKYDVTMTQDECEKYCKQIEGATGCMYSTSGWTGCVVFTYPMHVKREKGSTHRCLRLARRGRLTKPYKTNPNHPLRGG